MHGTEHKFQHNFLSNTVRSNTTGEKRNQQMHCNCVSFLKIYLFIAPICLGYSLAIIRDAFSLDLYYL